MSKRSAEKAKESQRRGSRLLEVIAVVLLGIATIGTAWCGYQSSRWNGEESDLARDAANAETEGARLFGLATQTVSYDSNIIAEYANAHSAGNERLKAFYRQVLVRPALLPLIDHWEAELAAGRVPVNLLDDQEYLDEQMAPYRASVAESEAFTVESQVAGEHADDYVLTTLLLASALFFAGITTSFRVRFAQVLLLVGASLTLAYAASRLVDLPIA
jgi:hypothetical protein